MNLRSPKVSLAVTAIATPSRGLNTDPATVGVPTVINHPFATAAYAFTMATASGGDADLNLLTGVCSNATGLDSVTPSGVDFEGNSLMVGERLHGLSVTTPTTNTGTVTLSSTSDYLPAITLPAGTTVVLAPPAAGRALADVLHVDLTGASSVTLVMLTGAIRYGITYNANGSTSGTVPVDTTTYLAGSAVVTKTNSGTLAKTGYVFSGWNGAANGAGTDWAEGSSFTISTASVTAYAKWTAA